MLQALTKILPKDYLDRCEYEGVRLAHDCKSKSDAARCGGSPRCSDCIKKRYAPTLRTVGILQLLIHLISHLISFLHFMSSKENIKETQ